MFDFEEKSCAAVSGRSTLTFSKKMKLHLVDLNSDVVSAWMEAFAQHTEVDIVKASILDIATDTIVSPANSHGFMDGGIDFVYFRHFGQQLQDRVRDMIYRRPEGILPVGTAEIVKTMHDKIPWLIVAPTMEMPEAVPQINAQRAFSAVLRLTDRHPELMDIYCPGFCTGVGQVSPTDSASSMEAAYSAWKRNKKEGEQAAPRNR